MFDQWLVNLHGDPGARADDVNPFAALQGLQPQASGLVHGLGLDLDGVRDPVNVFKGYAAVLPRQGPASVLKFAVSSPRRPKKMPSRVVFSLPRLAPNAKVPIHLAEILPQRQKQA